MKPHELTPHSFAIVELVRERQLSVDDAATAILMALGQLAARHYPDATTSAREVYQNVMVNAEAFRVFELAFEAQKRVKPVIVTEYLEIDVTGKD